MEMVKRNFNILCWTLSLAVVSVSIIVWGESFNWSLSKLTAYKLFPVLGLLAFGLMWTHYIVAVLRHHLKLDKTTISSWYDSTSILVLVLILSHPLILMIQLSKDGYGFGTPAVANEYAPQDLKWAVYIASVALIIFLSYELRRWFKNRKWWLWIELLSDAGMVLIFIHGLKLGRHLQSGWFPAIWLLYGVTLIFSIIYLDILRFRQLTSKSNREGE